MLFIPKVSTTIASREVLTIAVESTMVADKIVAIGCIIAMLYSMIVGLKSAIVIKSVRKIVASALLPMIAA